MDVRIRAHQNLMHSLNIITRNAKMQVPRRERGFRDQAIIRSAIRGSRGAAVDVFDGPFSAEEPVEMGKGCGG